jgi:hypothetical protein
MDKTLILIEKTWKKKMSNRHTSVNACDMEEKFKCSLPWSRTFLQLENFRANGCAVRMNMIRREHRSRENRINLEHQVQSGTQNTSGSAIQNVFFNETLALDKYQQINKLNLDPKPIMKPDSL